MVLFRDRFYETKEAVAPKLRKLFDWQKEHFTYKGFPSNPSHATQGAYYSLMSALMARRQLDAAARDPTNGELVREAKNSVTGIDFYAFPHQLSNGLLRMIDFKLRKVGLTYDQVKEERVRFLETRRHWRI